MCAARRSSPKRPAFCRYNNGRHSLPAAQSSRPPSETLRTLEERSCHSSHLRQPYLNSSDLIDSFYLNLAPVSAMLSDPVRCGCDEHDESLEAVLPILLWFFVYLSLVSLIICLVYGTVRSIKPTASAFERTTNTGWSKNLAQFVRLNFIKY